MPSMTSRSPFPLNIAFSMRRGEQKVHPPRCGLRKCLLNIHCLILRSWIWKRQEKMSWLECRMTVMNGISWCATRRFVVRRILNHFSSEVHLSLGRGLARGILMILFIHLRKLIRMFVELVQESRIMEKVRICARSLPFTFRSRLIPFRTAGYCA
jgi:hypothetical protein